MSEDSDTEEELADSEYNLRTWSPGNLRYIRQLRTLSIFPTPPYLLPIYGIAPTFLLPICLT